MMNRPYNRYDTEALREYIGYTIVAVIFLFVTGFNFVFEYYYIAFVFGLFALIFAIVVILHYYELIQSVDEIEGFFTHFGLIFFMKFSLSFGAGYAFARQQYLECAGAVLMAAILSGMVISGYRDMLKEKYRMEMGERPVSR